jgi:hypothetical protein
MKNYEITPTGQCLINYNDNRKIVLELDTYTPTNNHLADDLKAGEIGLTTICEGAKALLDLANRNKISLNRDIATRNLNTFISSKKKFYKNRWFGGIRQWFSEKCGSISLANRTITQIQPKPKYKNQETLLIVDKK